MAELDLRALALAVGIPWGLGMALFALTAPYGWNAAFVAVMAESYIGYGPGPVGALVGFVWGFLDAAIGAFVIGWLYKRFADWSGTRARVRSGQVRRV